MIAENERVNNDKGMLNEWEQLNPIKVVHIYSFPHKSRQWELDANWVPFIRVDEQRIGPPHKPARHGEWTTNSHKGDVAFFQSIGAYITHSSNEFCRYQTTTRSLFLDLLALEIRSRPSQPTPLWRKTKKDTPAGVVTECCYYYPQQTQQQSAQWVVPTKCN